MVLDAIFSPISALPSIAVPEATSTTVVDAQPKDTGAPVVAPVVVLEPATDTVEISPQAVEAEGGALVADSPEMAVARIAPWPPRPEEGSIGWLLDNLRERERLEGQMFRLQKEANRDREIGEVAVDGKSPDDLRKEADELRRNGKLEEANELYQLANEMGWRNIPEDDPSTEADELVDAGERMLQRAVDKRMVASLLGMKLDQMEEAFQTAAEDVSLDDDIYNPYPVYYAMAEAAPA